MKKKILIIGILIAIITTSVYAVKGCYSIKCHACTAEFKRQDGVYACYGNVTWRKYDLEETTIKRFGKKYLVWRCPAGHTLYVPFECKDAMTTPDNTYVVDYKTGKLETVTEHYNK